MYGVLHLYLARDVMCYLELIIVIGWPTVLAARPVNRRGVSGV